MWRTREGDPWSPDLGDWLVVIDELVLVEQYYSVDHPEELIRRYDAALDVLETPEVGNWFRDRDRKRLSPEAEDTFRRYWLDGGALAGASGADVAEKIRTGFTGAFQAARARGKKLSVVSVVGATGPESFDVEYIEGENAVTVVMRIPLDATPPPDPQSS
jgi:hypothetical protein